MHQGISNLSQAKTGLGGIRLLFQKEEKMNIKNSINAAILSLLHLNIQKNTCIISQKY